MATANTRRDVSKDYSDLYNTPEEALDVLNTLTYFDPNKKYLDPCAGKGVITEWIRSNITSRVHANELYDHGYETRFKEDFLKVEDWDYDVIIQNPPYKLAKEFILKGFEVAQHQWVFCRLDFLTSKSRYEDLFKLGLLKEVFIFPYRVTCTKGVEEEPTANSVNYAWFHFDTYHTGKPMISWIEK